MESARKKILYVITKSNWGGAQRYVYDLATNAAMKDYEVVVVCGGNGTLVSRLHEDDIRTLSIEKLGRNVSLLKDISVFFTLYKIYRHEQPDVVHLNSSKITAIGSLAARCARTKKIISTAHGWPFNEDRPFFIRGLLWLASWVSSLCATHIIVLSKKEELQAKRMPFVERKVTCIKNGIASIEKQLLDKQSARQSLSLPHEAIVVGTIGELHRNKDHALFLKSFAGAQREIQNLHACIIGDGEERARLLSLANTLGIVGHVTFAGYREHAFRLIRAFDIFVLSSRKEGLPYVLLESANARVPVIATRVGGIPEIIGDAGKLIPSQDIGALTFAIKELSADAAKREQLGQAFHERVAGKFSFEGMLARTLALY